MTIHDILSKLDEVVDELKHISSRVGKIEEQTERIEALHKRNDSGVVFSTPIQGQVGGKVAPTSHKPVEKGSPRPSQPIAELPGEPEFAERVPLYPILPHFLDPDATISVEETAARIHPSLRGGWGDEDAEDILYNKLVAFCSPPNQTYRNGHLNEDLLLPVQAEKSSSSKELAVIPRNVHHYEANGVCLPASRQSIPQPDFSHSPSVAPHFKVYRAPGLSRPVFGLPSTPHRRIVSSFDITRSPFAIYSDQNSPFLQLTKSIRNYGSTIHVIYLV